MRRTLKSALFFLFGLLVFAPGAYADHDVYLFDSPAEEMMSIDNHRDFNSDYDPFEHNTYPLSEKFVNDTLTRYKVDKAKAAMKEKPKAAYRNTGCTLNGNCVVDTATTWNSGSCPPNLNSLTVNAGVTLSIYNCTVTVATNVTVYGTMNLYDSSTYYPELRIGQGLTVAGGDAGYAILRMRGATIKMNGQLFTISKVYFYALDTGYHRNIVTKYTGSSFTGIVNWGGSLVEDEPTYLYLERLDVSYATYGVYSWRYENGQTRTVMSEVDLDDVTFTEVTYPVIGNKIDMYVDHNLKNVTITNSTTSGYYFRYYDVELYGLELDNWSDDPSTIEPLYIPVYVGASSDDYPVQGWFKLTDSYFEHSATSDTGDNAILAYVGAINGDVLIQSNDLKISQPTSKVLMARSVNQDPDNDWELRIDDNAIGYGTSGNIATDAVWADSMFSDLQFNENSVKFQKRGLWGQAAWQNYADGGRMYVNNNQFAIYFPASGCSISTCTAAELSHGIGTRFNYNQFYFYQNNSSGSYLAIDYADGSGSLVEIAGNDKMYIIGGPSVSATGFSIHTRNCATIPRTYVYDNNISTSGYDIRLSSLASCSGYTMTIDRTTLATYCNSFGGSPNFTSLCGAAIARTAGCSN